VPGEADRSRNIQGISMLDRESYAIQETGV